MTAAALIALGLGVILSASASAQTEGLVACAPLSPGIGAIVVGAEPALDALADWVARDGDAADFPQPFTRQDAFTFSDVPLLLSSIGRTLVLFDTDLTDRGGAVIGTSGLAYGLTAQDTAGCRVLIDMPVCEMDQYPGFYRPC